MRLDGCAEWHGRRAGTYGDAGVYSLYATKTISTVDTAARTPEQSLSALRKAVAA